MQWEIVRKQRQKELHESYEREGNRIDSKEPSQNSVEQILHISKDLKPVIDYMFV